MYSKILVAVDVNQSCDKLIGKARQVLAEGGEIYLVSVMEVLGMFLVSDDVSGVGSSLVSHELQGSLETAHQQRLEQLGEQYQLRADCLLLREGATAREIRAAAEEIGAELIIVGTHGRHGLELLLGSISNGVLHGTPCDVLAVKVPQ